MRANITFDTLEYMDELKKSGMRQEEAEAITKATQRALNQLVETKDLATKNDLSELRLVLKSDIHDAMWRTIKILATFQIVTVGVFTLIQHFFK